MAEFLHTILKAGCIREKRKDKNLTSSKLKPSVTSVAASAEKY